MASVVLPDVAGFRDAQQRLRAALGAEAAFLIPTTAVWDPSEPLDPDTSRPMDPFAEPTSGGDFTEVVKKVSFVARPLTSGRALSGDVHATPLGNIDQEVVGLIVDLDDYPDVSAAVRVRVAGSMWDLESWRRDALGPIERWIAYLERA